MVANVQALLLLQLVLVLILSISKIGVDFDGGNSSLGWHSLFSVLLDVLIEGHPLLEHHLHVLHLVVGVEQSCHSVQKVLIVVQVVHAVDLIQFELLLDGLVLEVLVAGQVDDQFIEQVVRVTAAIKLVVEHWVKLLLELILERLGVQLYLG